ncbi:SANT domain [Macleaya cordata]|uniref:SANT domain n=1 Tax=Macleaya cordata TaxID=56857 RepID=A0A200Q1G7_MACCD|nr:SANT domain [Macleaya cordata]
MDSVKEDTSGDCIIEETSAMDSDAPDVSDICGDRKVLPRVGFQYQAKIPPLITESERLQLTKTPTDLEVMDNVAHSFIMGLPIPIMWVSNEVDSSKHDTNGSSEYQNSKPRQNYSNKEASKLKTEPSDSASDCENRSGSSEDCEQTVEQEYKDKVYFPVPGYLGNSWSDFEKESFLLGIYIFGKNLVQVKRFIEGKEMGDILSFYYGKFYRSDGHRKWLECRKRRSRKRIHGQRIFTGWRQQEFLSRLLPRVAEKCQNTLVEVSKTFGEGKISLEEYVSTIKATVGLGILVEVVGIGKGKQDLTGIVTEPTRANHVISTRPKISVGKAYSTLTFEEIIRFLRGDFRLSKARSNDLFWEAVWPCLLAKGWHSEQPKNHIGTRSKHSLVFIIPGVKKFSRRKLVKGDHYFDSVTDVLNKVASDPRLLELEVEPAKGGIDNQENGWGAKKMKLGKGSHSDHHSYLPPRLLKNSSDLTKFTVVDTSLGDGEDSFPVRELRSLPIDTTNISTPTSLSSEKDEDGFEEPVHELDVADMPSNSQGDSITSRSTQGMSDGIVRPEYSNCAVSVSKQEMVSNGPDQTNVTLDNHRDQNAGNPDKDLRKTIKCQFSRRKKSGQSNYLFPVTKRRRLTACCQAEASCSKDSFSIGRGLREEDPYLQLGSPSASDNMVSEVRSSQDKLSTSSSAKGSPEENCIGKSVSQEKYPPRNLIDLNIPFVPSDLETGEPFITEVENGQNDPSSKEAPFLSSDVASAEQQPIGIARRQGTRNRPLTTRALEAFACGFLNTKRKPRPSLQARGGIATREKIDGVAAGTVSKVEEGVDSI